MSSSTLTMPVDQISAYYCLLFPNFAYYLQTLSVSIGRRPSVRSGASASSSDIKELVDIDLGPLSQVSRLHARIDYDDDQELFVLVILGRNGAWVDGVWYASGRRVPLGARTQITIANQTFHFLLPSAPDSDDSQSITSHSSRGGSPSVDIMSMSPATIPRSPSADVTDEEEVEEEEEEEEKKPRVGKGKKRKKPTTSPRRAKGKLVSKMPPDEMPPKPSITYANLSYRAIKSQGGRAALKDICKWIATHYEWYRLNEGTGWESSVRHTLSSNKAFTKVKRKASDRGKGFLWTVNKLHESTFESHDAGPSTSQSGQAGPSGAATASASGSTSKKTAVETEKPPGAAKGALPTPATTPSRSTPVPTPPPGSSAPPPSQTASTTGKQPSSTSQSVKAAGPSAVTTPTETPKASTPAEIPASLVIPIVVKELPPGHPALLEAPPTTGAAATILSHQPIIHDKAANMLVLSPIVFGSLTQVEITDLQNLGARKALDILRGQYTQFLKERLAAGRKKSKHKHKMKPADPEGIRTPSTATPDATVADAEPALKKRKLDVDVVS